MNLDREQRRKRILAITEELMTGMVLNGELNPDDDVALRKAAKQCAADATATYDAAVEHVSG